MQQTAMAAGGTKCHSRLRRASPMFGVIIQRNDALACSSWPPCLGFAGKARLEMRPPMHHRCNGLVGPNRPHWALLARGRPADLASARALICVWRCVERVSSRVTLVLCVHMAVVRPTGVGVKTVKRCC